jgi:hypothetical protein
METTAAAIPDVLISDDNGSIWEFRSGGTVP